MSIFNWRELRFTDPQAYRKLKKIRRAGQVRSPFGSIGTVTSPEARRQFRKTLAQILLEKAGRR